LVKPPGQVVSGQILLEGQDIYDLSPAALRRLRSARLAYIPQAAMNALNPVVSVVDQIAEAILLHQPLGN
jgi:ABC-type glutathione transport system ATPase component